MWSHPCDFLFHYQRHTFARSKRLVVFHVYRPNALYMYPIILFFIFSSLLIAREHFSKLFYPLNLTNMYHSRLHSSYMMPLINALISARLVDGSSGNFGRVHSKWFYFSNQSAFIWMCFKSLCILALSNCMTLKAYSLTEHLVWASFIHLHLIVSLI